MNRHWNKVALAVLLLAFLLLGGGIMRAAESSSVLLVSIIGAAVLTGTGLTVAARMRAADLASQAVQKLEAEQSIRLARLEAEFDQYRRRAQRERDEAILLGTENALKELLPPLDNLDRALAASQTAGTASSLLEGIQLVQAQFFAALDKLQIKRIEPIGQPFDPAFHEAVQQVDSPTTPPGHVAVVYQRGYVYAPTNRLLRPARVAVAAKQEPERAP